MAALAVVGLAAALAAHDRSDDAVGRSGLPLIGLTLSGNDVAHFDRIYDRLSGDNRNPRFYRDNNRWRRAQLRYDGTVYNVRVKSHGRDPDGHSVEHEGHRFISLSVKMAPGDRVAGLNRFKLIVGENLFETQQLVMTAAREAHVLVQDHRLVRVQINNWREHLFYFSNLLDDEYAEAAGQASLRTVSYDFPDDGLTDKALVYTDSPQYRGTTFDFPEHFTRALTQMGVPRTDWEPLLRRYSDFNTAISGFGAADPADFFDLEYLGRYETIRYVLGLEGHGFEMSNLRVFLNTANGKFYPALSRDNILSTLDLSGNRTPELQLNRTIHRDPVRELVMFHFVARSDRIRQAIYRAVYRFMVQDGERLVRELDRGLVEGGSLAPAELAIVRPAAHAGSGTGAATNGSGVPVGRGESRALLTSNMQSLRQYLERSAPEYSAQLSRGRIVLEIRPDSMAELRVKRLTIGLRDGAQTVGTPVSVHITEGPDAQGDPQTESVAVDWLADGRLDVSRALADARFATGLDRSIPPVPPSPPRINVRWVVGLDADRRRALEERFGLDAENEVELSTWSYALADESRANITALVQHPDVEDTNYIDRAEMTLEAGAFRWFLPEQQRYRAPSLERVPRLYTLLLTVSGVPADDLRPEQIDLVFTNTVTGQEVEARRVTSHDVGDARSQATPTALPPAPAVEAWLAAHPHLDIRQTTPDELRLRRGAYRLPEHLVLPRGYNLRIDSGTDLQLGAGVVLLVRGGLHINGSADQPVTIRPIEPGQPFGSVAVVGDGSQRTDVTYLELSGGSDAWLDGAQFTGALSIHYQDRVSVSHTTIRDNQGADGLSIKYAAGAVTDSRFTGNRDDQVDLEYFDGIVRDSRFESAPTGDSNGDGLDLRGSRVVVVNNELTGAADKAASVGEESEALFVSNRVGHSAIGVAVKDLSTAYLYDNWFEENGRDVHAAMKKPFYGGGRVVFAGARARQMDLSVDIDGRSTQFRIPAGVVERIDLTGLQPERVVESLSALSALSEGR